MFGRNAPTWAEMNEAWWGSFSNAGVFVNQASLQNICCMCTMTTNTHDTANETGFYETEFSSRHWVRVPEKKGVFKM